MRRKKSWKDDLPALFGASLAQFGILRLVEWAIGNQVEQPLAKQLVDYRFFFAPQIVTVAIVFLFFRLIRHVLDVREVRFGDWLRSSALLLLLALLVPLVVHLDQVLAFLAGATSAASLQAGAQAVAASPVYGFLSGSSILRWSFDLVGLLIALLALQLGSRARSGSGEARDAVRGGDWARAGELYLKAGDVSRAKKAFRKANAPVRLAALEQREGRHAEAAALYEQAGPAFAWEASRAWEAAGEAEKARRARDAALAEARASARWDRLAEVAEVAGDDEQLEEACRRLAETKPAGPGRTGLYRRAAEAATARGNLLGAAEAYRAAGESALAGEAFLRAGRPAEALRELEKAGDLARAAEAATAAGDAKAAAELGARDAELKGDLDRAAEAWLAHGSLERAANLFERRGHFARAGEAYRALGRHDRAAPLLLKAGEKAGAAASFETAGQAERAAALFRELGNTERAAALFLKAGRPAEAAEALVASGRDEEAISLFSRAGRGLDAARCALRTGHRDRAWELLTTVPRSQAGVAAFFLDLAEAHIAAAEWGDAAHVLREALGPSQPAPGNLPLHEALARAWEGAGDLQAAADRLTRIAQVDPGFRDAGERARRLAGEALAAPPTPPKAPAPPAEPPAAALTGPSSAPSAPSAPTVPPPAGVSGPSGRPVSGVQPGLARPGPKSGSFRTPIDPDQRYELVDELGRGGMGVVWKALDRKLDRYVALKILPASLWGDDTAVRYFEREAKAIAALAHPNIVALYDFGEGFGSAYLAMEYLEGPNLQSLLKTEPSRPKANWREWFTQAARGVAAAHARGILHRDLKPANLMLDRHGTLRILDFGLARPQAESGTTSKLIGTPAFFPPEVLRGESPSPASDVYSLGATFYTLATGRWPYVGDDVLVARLEREPDDPRPLAPFLSADEVEVLLKSLARFRPERYPDAGELLAALLTLEG